MAVPYILWDNIFEDNTVVATSTAAGYSAQNIKDWRSYTFWQGSTGVQYLSIDAGVAVGADALAIHSHNLGSASAVISVEGSTRSDFSTASTALTTQAVTADTQILTKLTSTGLSFRYWRVKINTAGHALAPKLAICCLGTRTDFPTAPIVPTIPYEIGISGDGKLSKSGALLGAQVRYKPVKLDYTFKGTGYTYTWVNGTFKPFWVNHAALLKPFFFSLDADNLTDAHWLARIPPDSAYNPKMSMLSRYDELPFEMEALWGE